MLEYAVLIAAVASLFAAFAYIRSMFKGQTKPNRVTWIMWSIAPLIATAASLSSQVSWAVVPVFMSGLSPLLIFIASFLNKKAYWKTGVFDYVCGVLSGSALVFWYLTSDPNLAIAFAIVSDAAAAVPTLTKAWRRPETESIWPFVAGAFGPMTSFLAATTWAFSELAFPTYLILVNLLIFFATKRKASQ